MQFNREREKERKGAKTKNKEHENEMEVEKKGKKKRKSKTNILLETRFESLIFTRYCTPRRVALHILVSMDEFDRSRVEMHFDRDLGRFLLFESHTEERLYLPVDGDWGLRR